MATSRGVHERMKELAQFFPPGVTYVIPYDTSPFVAASIEKVLHTLVEAMLLVFAVMFVFLQKFRYTIIPALVVPVALLGACAVILAAGFSINVLTMFAMVLAIGILVDDAIVVIENVERIMAEEGLSPKEATQKAMKQVSSAIIGITLVLSAVFVPMAFFPGAVGVIYKQFSLTMVASILFSGFLAQSFTPALCASLLKPIPPGHHGWRGVFRWFNLGFRQTTRAYTNGVGWVAHRTGRLLVVYLALLVGLGWMFLQLPSSFLPNEDQGFVLVDLQTPPESSANRTLAVIRQVEDHFRAEKAVDQMALIRGFSFSGAGDNAGLAFVTLKEWSERGPEDSAAAISARANAAFFRLRDAVAFALSPPPIQGLGTSNGFTFRLQDRSGRGYAALVAAAGQLLAGAAHSPVLTGLRIEGMPETAQIRLIIDREKANTFGVSFTAINSAVSANLGSVYVNDFPNAGRMQQVTVQADQERRMQPEDLLTLNVRNANGGMVPLSAFARIEWQKGPAQVVGFNGYPSMRISGNAAPGYSSGAAIEEMERLASELPPGFGYEWAGQSLQEIQSGNQAPFLIAMVIIFVFLLLAALYESWSIPLSVMLVVPLGVIGSVLAVTLYQMPNDVYFKVGLITIIGLSAKNAILIVEFARNLRAEGKPLLEATMEACQIRFRPILMTSLAFTFGVLPLAIARGASAASQNAIGIGVIGGMISATVLAVFFVPVFFVVIMRLVNRRKEAASEVGGYRAEAPAE
jgi:multidrug efflux pump